MKLKIKNYTWNGFGFPILFKEVPAIKVRGELVPDINFSLLAKPIIEHICTHQEFPFSGNQIKFIRMFLEMSLREFSKFMGVTHQSVMRWEKAGKASAQMGGHIEFVMKIKILKKLDSASEAFQEAIDHVEDVENLKPLSYKQPKPLLIPEGIV